MSSQQVKPPSAESKGIQRRPGWWSRHQGQLIPYVFIAPNVAVFTAFMFFPIVFAFFISFHQWSLIGTAQFVGFDNYLEMIQDDRFWGSLRNTVVYTAGTVPTSIALGLVVAIALNRKLPARGLLRSIYFMPVVVSLVVVGLVGAWMFDDNYGLINALLAETGIGRIPWLSSPRWAMVALILTTLWTRIGFNMVVYLASLQAIPGMYYDAAKVDGATSWGQFLHITLPLLSPTTFLLVVINVIYSFHVFDLVYVMTGGGPGFSTTVLNVYIYQTAFETSEMGYASAMGVVLFLLILVFTIVHRRVTGQA
jgi:multiple sugar transport system permease protein